MKSYPRTLLAAVIGVVLGSAAVGQALAAPPRVNAVDATAKAESPTGRYIVTFDEPGLVEYRGDTPGLARTAPIQAAPIQAAPGGAAISARKFNRASTAAHDYAAYLSHQRENHIRVIEQALGRPLAIHQRYEVARHGVSVALSPAEAAIVAGVDGVRSVTPVRVQSLSTFGSPGFIGSRTLWDGSQVPAGMAPSRGEGIRIGVIDSGANSPHPSFANDASCGFSAANPKLIARDCTANSSTGGCIGTNPEADAGVGHGVHTASTAAGNVIDITASPPPDLLPGQSMSGVAPCAQVVSYKACIATGCYDDMLHAAIETAIVDQVDVINYSLGQRCGYGSPWEDGLDLFAAFSADVFVAASAGNTAGECTDPTGRVANISPWVTTVAASSSRQIIAPALTVAGPGSVPASFRDIALSAGTTTLPAELTSDLAGIPLRASAENPIGCTADGGFPPGHFNGSVAVVARGICSFTEKITNAAAAGARVVVITNNTGATLGMDTTGAPTNIPAFSIADSVIGNELIAFVTAHQGPALAADAIFGSGFEAIATGNYVKRSFPQVQGDILGNFSLRGPVPPPLSNLAKPDISAPGVVTYAAIDAASGNYGVLSGTSMASPHIAGGAALLRKLHPGWAVDEIKSALMTTASTAGLKQDGVRQWDADDVGSGRVDLTKAARAGLTFTDSTDNYLAANPNGGSLDLTELNLPSLRNIRCGDQCSWTRKVRNRLTQSGTWTASFVQPSGYTLTAQPATFTLAPGAVQEVTFSAAINDITVPGAYSFGRVVLKETSGRSPDQQLPVVVQGSEISVECNAGNCTFDVDNFFSGYSAIGCDTACAFVWLNRYSPPPSAFPITLTSVTFLTGSSSYVHAGDRYDVYVYQDDDRDPTNGAVLAGSHKGYTIATAGARLRVVNLATPIVLNGPGDVVIALSRPNGTGPRPATAEVSEFRGRSYTGNYVGEDPDLGSAAVALKLNPEAIGSNGNYVIRATGTNGSGKAIELGGAPGE
jgi:subtilisin family serine protease